MPFAFYIFNFQTMRNQSSGDEKGIQNLQTEPEGVIRRRTECTPSDEDCGFCAVYRAIKLV